MSDRPPTDPTPTPPTAPASSAARADDRRVRIRPPPRPAPPRPPRRSIEPDRRSGDDRRVAERAPQRRPGQRRLAVARSPPAPAEDDRLARPADHPARPSSRGPSRASSSTRSPASSSRRTRCSCSRRSPCSISGSRCAACAGRCSFAAPATRSALRDATEIIFISWLVNCLVPAKLGDLYRAYLLKINSTVSLSRTFGTVFIERVLDLFAIVVFGLGSGYWSFRGRLPDEVQVVFADRRRRRGRPGRRGSCRCATSDGGSSSPCRSRTRSSSSTTGSRRASSRPSGCGPAPPDPPDRAHLDDRGDAPLPRGRGARLPRRPPRHQRRILRGADRIAADRRAVHAGRNRRRRARRRLRAHARSTASRRRRRSRSPSSTG